MQDLIERLLCCSRNALLAQRLFFSRGAISATTGIWEMIPTQPKRWRFSAVYPPAARYDYTTVRTRYMSDAHATEARQGSGECSAHSTCILLLCNASAYAYSTNMIPQVCSCTAHFHVPTQKPRVKWTNGPQNSVIPVTKPWGRPSPASSRWRRKWSSSCRGTWGALQLTPKPIPSYNPNASLNNFFFF